MEWSNLVTMSQQFHGGILFVAVELDEKDEVLGGSAKVRMVRRFGWYVDDFLIFGTEKTRVEKVYFRFYSAFVKKWLPPKLSECRRVEKDLLTVMEVMFNKDGKIEQDTEK